MGSRSKVVQAAAGATLTVIAHSWFGVAAANALWIGRDSPGEWTFYLVGAGCLLLPVTVAAGWILTRFPRTRHLGRGALVGTATVAVLAAAAAVTGWAPPWISEGWTGTGWK
ncbi:hypothetical protein [Micromonospora sp. 4G55]|uniref:hypothetical protein n=1 Tax=Micromonospora sp. 4G55 TaxID=2806102 RepID=UPI001A55B69F|nr:hypothetical protein [Micromonospora sp. 4G55]MBM0258813.1 hypothetical protein [Micromonospora sp. 4G55]